MLNNANVLLLLEDGKFVLYHEDGSVIAVFDSSKEASRFAFANGADSVKYDYNLTLDKSHAV